MCFKETDSEQKIHEKKWDKNILKILDVITFILNQSQPTKRWDDFCDSKKTFLGEDSTPSQTSNM